MTTIIEQLFAEMQDARDAREAAEFRADQAEYEVFVRAKYSTQDKKDMLKAGHAMANPNGDPSYPIKDKEDLQRAISAVGRGSADHDAIRKHIIKRATALGLASMIPDNWDMMTGAMKDTTSTTGSTEEHEEREDNADADADAKDCPTCGGDGKIMAGHRKCPDCQGKGTVPANFEKKSSSVPVATWIDESTAAATRNVNHEPGYRSAPEDADDRVNAHREQQVIREILALPEDQREEMINAAPDPEELRAAITSYNDLEASVESALSNAFGKGDGGPCDLWVCDAGEDGDQRWAVFTSYVEPPGDGTFKVTFNCDDDGAITFTSNPVPVARVTTYEEIPAPVAPDLTAKSDAAVQASRDAAMLTLEREAEEDEAVRAKAIVDVPAKRSRKRSK